MIIRSFFYPATFTPGDKPSRFTIRFKDIPEAITWGDGIADALWQAADCLEEAIAGRIRRGDALPTPSRASKSQYLVPVPAPMAAKAALYLAMRHSKISKTELARRLGCDEKEIRRLLDPRHPSKLARMQSALAALGQRLVVGVRAA